LIADCWFLFKDCRSRFKSQEKLDVHKRNHAVTSFKSEELSDENDCLEIPAEAFNENANVDDSNDKQNHLIKYNETEKSELLEFTNHNNLHNSTQIFGLNNNNNFSNLKQSDFKCNYCQFRFNSNEQLNIHLKSHIDSKYLRYIFVY